MCYETVSFLLFSVKSRRAGSKSEKGKKREKSRLLSIKGNVFSHFCFFKALEEAKCLFLNTAVINGRVFYGSISENLSENLSERSCIVEESGV